MINEIDILHERHCCYFACYAGEKTAGLFCVVSYHHKIVVELGEYGFDTFTEPPICPCWRTPVFLIQSIWDFKRDVGSFKEILLNFSAEIALVSKHHAVMIFPAHIIEIMEVMDACGCHVIRMYDTPYSTDCMEFISIVVYILRCAISPVGSCIDIVTPHGAAFCPCVLTDLYRLGVNAEYILGTINGHSHILADFFGKPCRQLAPGVELPAADQVWQIILALIVQTMEKEILTVEAKSLGCYTESDDLKVGKPGDDATTGHVSEFINTISGEILADSEDSGEICYEVAHKQANSS